MRSHPGRERVLDLFGVSRRQAVLGLQDGDRPGLQINFRRGFDLLDELRPDRGGLLDREPFPGQRVGPVTGLELARTDRYRRGAGIGADCLVSCILVVGDVGRRIEVVLPCDAHHVKSA